ncbi:MAG: hypothetical protein WCJ35_11650 [Planctomycetota bacterium]
MKDAGLQVIIETYRTSRPITDIVRRRHRLHLGGDGGGPSEMKQKVQ